MVLDPSADVVAERDAARVAGTGKVAYTDGFTPKVNVSNLRSTPRDLGLWIDTSALSPEETVAQMLERHTEALVEPGMVA